MGLKNWPYWLKGGILSLIILSIIAILTFRIPSLYTYFYVSEFHGDYFTNPPGFYYIFLLSLVYIFIKGYFTFANHPIPLLTLFLIIILTAVYYFGIGAFIGWIYGKIKSKQELK